MKRDKVRPDVKKKIDGEPVYNKKFMKNKTRMKFYSDGTTDFSDKEMLKAGSDYTCLAVTNIDSALKKNKNYYS